VRCPTTLLCQHEPEVAQMREIPEPRGTAAAIPIGLPVGRGRGKITRKRPGAMVQANRFSRALEFDSEARIPMLPLVSWPTECGRIS
jgi:hypothetical protein